MGKLLGVYTHTPAADLGAAVLKACVSASGIHPTDVDAVNLGCVLMAGQGQAPARQASRAAGLPDEVVTTTVNKMCGSGMETIIQSCMAIHSARHELVLAGGMENMTRAPHLLDRARTGYRMGEGTLFDHMLIDGLIDAYENKHMGLYAEATAKKYQFTREAQDAFAVASLERAQAAQRSGAFKAEIAPVLVKQKNETITILEDEGLSALSSQKIPQLKPAFDASGTVTAANSAGIADGAAAVLLSSVWQADKLAARPLAKIVAFHGVAQAPAWFTTAPIGAIKGVLDHAGWTVSDVDLFEINEAFAVVSMAAMHDVHIPHEKVNVNGGACALGHPIGASGARIIVTLIHALKARGLKRGVAALCIGGGEALAMALELV
jgi:acetyl-CoA C-acetyltransferase